MTVAYAAWHLVWILRRYPLEHDAGQALPGHIARMAIGEAFWIVASGLAIGVPAAIATGLAARAILSGVLFELSSTDPLILSSSAVAILMIASLAAYVPARRASRIDPVAAVKCE